MSYYQGDFYQGDPGFFSVARGLLGRAAGFIPGVGPAISGVLGGLGRAKPGRMLEPVTQAIVRHPTLSAAGSAGLIGMGAGALTQRRFPGNGMIAPGGTMMRGFHMSKPRRGVPPHMVRNRRMRVTNPKALRRAIRRAHGFARLARKVMSFTSPRGVRGRAHFRVRRRTKR